MTVPLKITIAESSVIIRSGLLAALKQQPAFHLKVFEVTEAEQLRHALGYQQPDILLINPSFLSIVSLPQIRKEAGHKQMKCVAIQHSLSDAAALKAYDEVITVYDSVEQLCEKITGLTRQPTVDKPQESLSQREKEVLVCVIKGMTNKQTADHLRLSAHTVITHRRNISAKLQIHSVAGWTIFAIVNKLLDMDEVKGMDN